MILHLKIKKHKTKHVMKVNDQQELPATLCGHTFDHPPGRQRTRHRRKRVLNGLHHRELKMLLLPEGSYTQSGLVPKHFSWLEWSSVGSFPKEQAVIGLRRIIYQEDIQVHLDMQGQCISCYY